MHIKNIAEYTLCAAQAKRISVISDKLAKIHREMTDAIGQTKFLTPDTINFMMLSTKHHIHFLQSVQDDMLRKEKNLGIK